MAIRYDANTDKLTRTTTLPSITSFTIMAWVYRSGTGGGDHEAVFSFGNATSNYAAYVRSGPSLAVFSVTDWVTDFTGSAIVDATWYHLAMTVAGTGAGQLLGYMNGVLNCTGNGASITGSTLQCCSGPAGGTQEWYNGRMAALKVYGAVLTADELKAEMRSYLPVRTANLNTWSPLLASGDVGNYANTGAWTVGGTLATEDGPPIAWSVAPQRIRPRAAVAALVSPQHTLYVVNQAVPRAAYI